MKNVVRITASNPTVDLELQMSGPANLTAGMGGWASVPRVDDIAATDWVGQEPLQQEIPLLIDGYAEGRSVEAKLRDIIRLGRDVTGDENEPPILRITGPIFFSAEENPKFRWVLPDNGIELDADSQLRDDDGTLLRQAFTLNLLEYVKPGELRGRKKKHKSKRGEPGRTGGTAFPGRSYVTQPGDTLQSIAQNLYGDWKLWDEIGKLNGLHDANRKLPPKTKLKLPR